MKKNILSLICVFVVGIIVGAVAVYQFTQTVMEGKAYSYYAAGEEYFEKDIDEAMLFFFQASVLKPDWRVPHLGLAQLFEKKKNFSLAIKEYKKAIALWPNGKTASYENKKISDRIKLLQKEQEAKKVPEQWNQGDKPKQP